MNRLINNLDSVTRESVAAKRNNFDFANRVLVGIEATFVLEKIVMLFLNPRTEFRANFFEQKLIQRKI